MSEKLPPFETNLERFRDYELRRTAKLFPDEPFTIHLREAVPPSDIANEMRENAPQALLRDLHRPVESYGITGLEQHEIPWDRGARGTMAWLKSHFRADYRVPIESLLHTPKDFAEEVADRKRIIKMPWTEIPLMGLKAVTSSEPQFFHPGWDVPDEWK